MEDTLLRGLEHAPELLAIVAIVWMMFKFLEKMDMRQEGRHREMLATMRDIHDENIQARKETNAVIERNTSELARR